MFCANFNFQTRPRACLKIAFRQMCVLHLAQICHIPGHTADGKQLLNTPWFQYPVS